MEEIKSTIFPQKVADSSLSTQPVDREIRGPSFFKDGEDVLFMRPKRVISNSVRENSVRFVCETIGFLSRTVQTHETRLHQFLEMPEHVGTLPFAITFWSADIFQVRFAHDELKEETAAFPDKQRSMLIGSPETDPAIQVREDDQEIVIATEQIRLHITRELFHLAAYDKKGNLFWTQRRTDLFTSDIFACAVSQHNLRAACFEAFSLAPGEEIYGLGERFDAVARKGRAVDFWNKDAIGTSNTRTYINVPFLMSTRGYGLFLNSSARTEWDIATREAATLDFTVEDTSMEYFIIHGPSPTAILEHYASLTGFAPVPPIWSFGLWMSRNSYMSWDVVHEVADGLRRQEIPADVLHLDTYWFRDDWNCDLRFSDDRFGEPEKHMQALKEQGFRISLWQYNFVPPREDNANYKEGLERGYFATGPDGKLFVYPAGTTGAWIDDAIIDFSNSEAVTWYAEQIKRLIRMGASTIKTDFGEGIPEDAVFKNIDGKHFHNLYSLVYNSVVSEAIYEVSGEHIVWARSGTAGSQRYPVHWGGDSQCSWSGLAGSLRGALSLGLSGFPFFSHDIGGFIGRPDPELYIRWAQFGLFSSHARCHGAGNDNSREPWSFGEEANEIFKRYDQLRYRLLPYMYSQARRAAMTALPLVRALVIEYPCDRNVWHIEDQYMLGDALLIAPVLAPLAEQRNRSIYLPAGTWFDYWTKGVYVSRGEWMTREVDLKTMPIYVKNGSVLPYGALRQSTENEIGDIVQLEIYASEDVQFQYNDGVTAFTVSLVGQNLTVTGLDPVPPVKVY
jgi:alpha-D-xyloside xylohydrolase